MAASNNYESLQTSMGTVFLQKTYFWDPGEEIVKFLWGFLSERIMLGKQHGVTNEKEGYKWSWGKVLLNVQRFAYYTVILGKNAKGEF